MTDPTRADAEALEALLREARTPARRAAAIKAKTGVDPIDSPFEPDDFASGEVFHEPWRVYMAAALNLAPSLLATIAALREVAENLADELDDFLPLVEEMEDGQAVDGEEYSAHLNALRAALSKARREVGGKGGA